jgi:hypothetical protein
MSARGGGPRASNGHTRAFALSVATCARGAGVLEHFTDNRFALTSVGATLPDGVPSSTRAGVMMFHHSMFWRSWEELLHSVRTGRPALEKVFSMRCSNISPRRPTQRQRTTAG